MQKININAICALAKTDKNAGIFFIHLAYKDNNDLFTKTVTLANFLKSNNCKFSRSKLTPFLKHLENLGLGEFESHWKGKSEFRWGVKTKEFFGKLVNEGKI